MRESSILLTLYCDEIWSARLCDELLDERWCYIGILIVPKYAQQELLAKLLDRRCLNNKKWGECDKQCKLHKHNNTKIHYSDLGRGQSRYEVACSWLDLLFENAKRNWALIYFYILGLNLSNLNMEKFGSPGQQDRDIIIYNRFFRTAVQKSTKTFFSSYDYILIDEIYHDKGRQRYHPYMPWHAIYRLQSDDPKLIFGSKEITFMNSDHRQHDGDPIHSHFLQFIDIVLGCAFNILHYSSTAGDKEAIAVKAKPLLGDRIIKKPSNINSCYHYVNRQKIEFFPKENLSKYNENSLIYEMRRLNNFYDKERELRIERRRQPLLPFRIPKVS